MKTAREVPVCGKRWMTAVFLLLCLTPTITGVVDVTIVSKYQFFDESDDTWLYCYYTGSAFNQKGYPFGVEVDTGSGTAFTRQRGSGWMSGEWRSTRILVNAGDSRVGAFSCLVSDGSQTEKAITFKMKSRADVWPVAFTVTASLGDPVTLQMVRRSNRTGTLVWRKDGVGGTVLNGQNGLSLTIASVRSSDEGIYECYYQGDIERKQGIMRLIVRDCTENNWGPPFCTGDCPVCFHGGVCDDNTGECVCPPGFRGQNCESACTNGMIGTSCTRECDGGDCTGQLLCVMDPYGCSCAPGLMGIECNTGCPDGLYGVGCTQTCHCANGPAACDKKTGFCTGGCLASWTGDSCQIRSATVSYVDLFTKEEGRYFGSSADHITAYADIDAEECARRCLEGYDSYDGVNPICLSFNHRPAESPEGGSARCWLSSSDTDTAASPGPEWDSWPDRNYYQRKQIMAPQDCTDVFALGIQYSHVYTIGHPQPFQTYCDMDTDGGGWTVIQRRQDGSVQFDKTWTEYEQGFGNSSGEYWLGLGNIHSLTTQKQNELYVYLEDWEMNSRFARYSRFSVGNADSKYTATIDGYSGDAGDSLNPSTNNGRHSINNRQFSTTDQDNDPSSHNCAILFGQGGWWYTPSCGYSLLNGQYLTGCSVPSASCSSADGIIWYTWLGYRYSLKKAVMMIRPADFPVSSFRPCENGRNLTSGPENSGLYICACPAGWNGAFCDQACPSGEFGPECFGTCHCANGPSVCNIRTGVCSSGGCEAGWKGNNCHTVCSPGEFGLGCAGTCHCASGDSVCDIRTGVCSSGGCEAGWEGSNCQTVCSPGEFGPGCTGTCRCASGGSVCNIRTGVCSSGGCETGWKGSSCQTVCSPGEFGPGCTGTCHCASGDSVCDIRTGVCSSGGCEAGWKGSNCQTVCSPGEFGPGCTGTCHCASGDSVCDIRTGVCSSGGCEAGWKGSNCQTVCSPGEFGPGCTGTCHCASGDSVCDIRTGVCSSGGCETGWKGNNCQTVCSPGEFGPGCTGTCRCASGGSVCNIRTGVCSSGGCEAGWKGNNCQTAAESPGDVTVNVTAVNSTVLHVRWTLGVSGNLSIIDSHVRYKESDTEDWGPWSSTRVSDENGDVYIRGVRPGAMYDVQVRVNNSLGWSDPGNGTGSTDEAPPGPPRNLAAVPISHNSVHLTWDPPIETNGEIVNYKVQYGSSESCGEDAFILQVTTTDDSTTTAIGNLDPYTNYTFRVRGVNSAEEGVFGDCDITRTFEYYPTAPALQTFADQHDCNCRTPNFPRPVQLRVAWRRPDHIYGQLQAYRISLYNRTGGEPFYQENMTSVLQQENLTAVVTSPHLQPAMNYSVTVSAINTFYRGNESYPYMTRTSDGCKQPYGRMTGKELMKLLPGGYRLEKPALCPQDVYEVMKSCWETLPENRPTFPELKATLDRIIQDHKVLHLVEKIHGKASPEFNQVMVQAVVLENSAIFAHSASRKGGFPSGF
ncbi:hypothetical protein Bbelb_018030 [Branchiostoma belcheri]|nr:hypothetical protein Bbelb_018030 [Branchiostoma belcheri]